MKSTFFALYDGGNFLLIFICVSQSWSLLHVLSLSLGDFAKRNQSNLTGDALRISQAMVVHHTSRYINHVQIDAK